MRTLTPMHVLWPGTAAWLLAACAASPTGPLLGAEPKAACEALKGATITATQIAWPGQTSGAATVDSAEWMAATPLAVAERAPTPAAAITPATPATTARTGVLVATPSAPAASAVSPPETATTSRGSSMEILIGRCPPGPEGSSRGEPGPTLRCRP